MNNIIKHLESSNLIKVKKSKKKKKHFGNDDDYDALDREISNLNILFRSTKKKGGSIAAQEHEENTIKLHSKTHEKLTKEAFQKYPLIRNSSKICSYLDINTRKQNILKQKPEFIKKRKYYIASEYDSEKYEVINYNLKKAFFNKLGTPQYSRIIGKTGYSAYKSGNISIFKKATEQIEYLTHLHDGVNVIKLDIKDYFNKICHKALGSKVELLRNNTNEAFIDYFLNHVYPNICSYKFINRKTLRKLKLNSTGMCLKTAYTRAQKNKVQLVYKNQNHYGIPQGLSTVSILAEINLLDFDRKTVNYVKRLGGDYFRYADDMLIILPQTVDVEKVISNLKRNLSIDGTELKFNTEKQVISNFKSHKKNEIIQSGEMFTFLGIGFDGKDFFYPENSVKKIIYNSCLGLKKVYPKTHGNKSNLAKTFCNYRHGYHNLKLGELEYLYQVKKTLKVDLKQKQLQGLYHRIHYILYKKKLAKLIKKKQLNNGTIFKDDNQKD